MTESQQAEETQKEPRELMGDNIAERLMSSEFWLRLLYMLIFFVVVSVAAYVVVVVVIAQFLWALVTGEKNSKILTFSNSLSIFIHEIILFLSHNTEEKPFPFKDWPE